jgi:aspartate racemase
LTNKKAKHIGIVACSYEGAALCYKTVCNEGSLFLGPHAHPEISVHTHPLHEYMKFIEHDDWEGVAHLMKSSANKLKDIGAEVLVCPDNTIHQSFAKAKEGVTVPWLHIADEVAGIAQLNKFRKLGVLGTRYLMEGPVYREALSKQTIDFEIPSREQRIEINRIIFEELVYGAIHQNAKNFLLSVVQEFKSKGCDAVVLGCTELPLIIFPEESSLPTLDSTRILARAALRYAIE